MAFLFFECNSDLNKEDESEKLKKADLTFSKLTLNAKNSITKDEIFAKIKEDAKQGFQIKSIAVSDSEIAEVKGTKPNFSIKIKKVGTFTATIILEKTGFLDVKIENCEFEIKNKTFTFQKLTKIGGNTTITKTQILAQVQEQKDGYTIKSIAVSDSEIAEVKGTKPNFSIKIKKVGTFTATIILEKTGFLDVKIENCEFEIKNKTFTFQKLTKIGGNTTITKTQILAQVQEQKDGYTIKSIAVSDSEIAEVKGTKPNFSIKIKKVGTFTATIILEKTGFLDVKIENCEFKITPTSIEIYKIDISKFPEFKPDRGNWDVKYWGQSSSVRRPDLIWQIKRGSSVLFRLLDSDRDSNAEQGRTYSQIFSSPITITKGVSYEFHLSDYDTTSSNDYMGQVNFSVPDDLATSKIFKSANDKIHIKVYFRYN